MELTPLGAQVATMSHAEKNSHAQKLMDGLVTINAYTPNGVCYDTVAYTCYLLRSNFHHNLLLQNQGQGWLNVFNFNQGTKWDGRQVIPPGRALGFFRLVDRQFFHAALAVRGGNIRSVNGGLLGAGWQVLANLGQVLGKPNANKEFEYDRTGIEVWISNI